MSILLHFYLLLCVFSNEVEKLGHAYYSFGEEWLNVVDSHFTSNKILVDLRAPHFIIELRLVLLREFGSDILVTMNLKGDSPHNPQSKSCEYRRGTGNSIEFACYDVSQFALVNVGIPITFTDVAILAERTFFETYVGCLHVEREAQWDVANITECIQNCHLTGSIFAAIKGNGQCICLDEIEDWRNMRPNSECFADCPSKSLCGGSHVYAVYFTDLVERERVTNYTNACFHNSLECLRCEVAFVGLPCLRRDCRINNGYCSAHTCVTQDMGTRIIGICKCSIGFSLSFREGCRDIDECLRGAAEVCGENSDCSNAPGTYTCACSNGYQRSHDLCIDIDECQSGPCIVNSDCINTVGSYMCMCTTGYRLIGLICDDINECEDHSICNRTTSTCSNTIGSYRCTCIVGYTRITDTTCRDIDECLDEIDLCNRENTICVNVLGSYACECSSGLNMVDRYSCDDRDECILDDKCKPETSFCINVWGSYICRCKEGYSYIVAGDESDCRDVDECTEAIESCDLLSSTCKNLIGSYQCSCIDGFKRIDKRSCIDVDECEEMINSCDLSSECVNTRGSYHCSCRDGMTLKQFPHVSYCEDIDECNENNPCGEDLLCINNIGTYSCECLGTSENHLCSRGTVETDSNKEEKDWITNDYSDYLTTDIEPENKTSMLLFWGIFIASSILACVLFLLVWRWITGKEANVSDVSATSF